MTISRVLATLLVLLPSAATAQGVQPGEWTGKITVRELVAPGVPGFLVRMARGKSRSEKRCISPALAATGPAALISPDPKAKCSVASQRLAGGRYEQVLMCPQKKGTPLRIERSGRYDANGVAGEVRMAGSGPKGEFRFIGDQTVTRTRGTCR